MENPIKPNTKIRILSEEHSAHVQKLAFDAGFRWYHHRYQEPLQTCHNAPFLYFSEKMTINHGVDENFFNSHDLKEIFIDLPANQPTDEDIEHSDAFDGQKHDTDKPRYDLMPVHAEAAVVDVLTFGAKKYAPDNWRHVESATDRYTAAALRHIAAYRMGEREDQESGLPHLAHAVCCLMFMLELGSEADK